MGEAAEVPPKQSKKENPILAEDGLEEQVLTGYCVSRASTRRRRRNKSVSNCELM